MPESEIKRLNDEREKLIKMQSALKRALEKNEMRIRETNCQIRDLKISNDADANSRLSFEMDEARLTLQRMLDRTLGEHKAFVNISISFASNDAKFENYDF